MSERQQGKRLVVKQAVPRTPVRFPSRSAPKPVAVEPPALLRVPQPPAPRLVVAAGELPLRVPARPPPSPAPASPPPSPRGRMPPFFSARYRALALIGPSDKWPVLKARDRVLDTVVAIKLMPRHVTLDPDAVEQIKREATLAMGLSHENIVRLYNLETEGGRVFMVMEYVDGHTLREILARDGRLALDRVMAVAGACGAALDYAHRRGVLHRDLKPDNLMLGRDGVLKIIDLGTARPVHIHAGGFDEDYIEGTPGYASPEQARGLVLDARTDVFSLAATLAELLTGRPAFPAGADMEVVCTAPHAPLTGVPEAVAAALSRGLATDRDARFSSASEFLAALTRATGG